MRPGRGPPVAGTVPENFPQVLDILEIKSRCYPWERVTSDEIAHLSLCLRT
jgi:hypothetical protein